MATVNIKNVNHTYIRVLCDEPAVTRELWEQLSFDVPGAKFMPAARRGYWDGQVHLYNIRTALVYAGLQHRIEAWAAQFGFPVTHDHETASRRISSNSKALIKWVESQALPHAPHQHQLDAFVFAVKMGRGIVVSPTASGKSLIAYLLALWYLEQGQRPLIIVPTKSLVKQLISDFKEYGYTGTTHGVCEGADKDVGANITVTTWQAVYTEGPKYFSAFSALVGDEVHLFKARSLSGIMVKCPHIYHRIGLTGTLDGTKIHQWILEGLFGPIHQVASTTDLQQQGLLAPLNISMVLLEHPPEVKPRSWLYHHEIECLVASHARNKYITKLATALKGNTLVLYTLVEKHGETLFRYIKTAANKQDAKRPVFFVHGKVDADERESVRSLVEQENNAIIIASYGTFSTGINIKRLHNIIFASPSKSRIRVFQSIGRSLRLGSGKTHAKLFDIADSLYTKRRNFTLGHAAIRKAYYEKEGFPLSTFHVRLKG